MRKLFVSTLLLLAFTLAGCNQKSSPTEPGVDTPWAVRVRVLDVITQRPLNNATVSFIGTSGDGVSLPTNEDGLTQAVTIYQTTAPQQITIHVESGGIILIDSLAFNNFTGAVGFTESFDPRENKSVWIGNVYLSRR